MAIKVGVSTVSAALRKLLAEIAAYINRVVSDGGTVVSESDANKVVRWLKQHGLLDSTELLYLSNAGLSIRDEAGNLRFVEKVYSLDQNATPNDGTQTTELDQPRLVGGIAPGSKPAAANLNGESRYFTHPLISFGAGESWTLSFCIKDNYTAQQFPSINRYFNGTYNSAIYLGKSMSSLRNMYISTRTPFPDFNSKNLTDEVGKNYICHVVVSDTSASLYINGNFIQTVTGGTSEIIFTRLFGTSDRTLYGSISFYKIQSGALTTQQVADEYTLLRSIYPEIESVDIGTQTWATRNFEAVATPEGSVIAEVTENGAVEKIPQPLNFLLSAWTTLGVATKDSANTFTSTGAAGMSGPFLTIGKWYKLTIDGTSTISDATVFCGATLINNTISGTKIFKAGAGNIYIRNGVSGTTTINTLLVQELNWSNSTEIYDAVYAATSGTAEEKEYAALKEAAMWCYYDNSADNGAIYGKLFNGYAKKLFKADMLSAAFGWHIGTDAEYQLIDDSAYDLMYGGTDYWTTDNGTNITGFTALGGGHRLADGTFSTIKGDTRLWVGDEDKTVQLTDNSDTVTIPAEDLRVGAYLRLVED